MADKENADVPVKQGIKKKKVVKVKTVKLMLDWKLMELSVDERLPEWFLQSKLKEDQRYIPIHIYREIMRQMDCFGVPQFSDPEKFMSGKNKSQIDMITYRVKCTVEWNKDGRKNPVILTGAWYSAMSGGTLLSDAIHWNIATLDAKALRSALKHSSRIFEYPELDVVDIPTPAEIKETAKKADDILSKVAGDMKPTEKIKAKPVATPVDTAVDIEKVIRAEYAVLLAELDKALTDAWFDKQRTKEQILNLATQLKTKHGEQHKPLIIKIITWDLNQAK